MMKKYDVAVVGGGPAGCSAAIHLASRGADVVLFEADSYPHDTLCGEFLSPECPALLERLGVLPAVAAMRPAQVDAVRLTAVGGGLWEAPMPGPGVGLTRRALDAALAERAAEVGVEVRDGTTVTAISGDLTAGFSVETDAGGERSLARAAIAAYGKRSNLDRALERPFFQEQHPFVALKAHFRQLPVPGCAEMHAFPGGYCGIAEVEDGLSNVCLLVRQPVFQQASADGEARREAFVAWMQAQNEHLRQRMAGAERVDEEWLAIAQIAFGYKSAAVGDILMAGDAAGLIAPIAGDGIGTGLRSGEMAAEYTGRYLEGRLAADELADGYSAAWRGEFGRRLRLSLLIQRIMLRPRLFATGLRLLPLIPPLGQALIRNTRGL